MVVVSGAAGAAQRGSTLTRSSAIYAAVIRQLVTEENTSGANDPGFTRIYVVNGPVADAGDASGNIDQRPEHRFSSRLRRALLARLDDLPPIRFVRDAASVIEDSPTGTVSGGGAVVRVGPIPDGARRVEVGGSIYIANLAGQWLTYVVERVRGRWRVTGTTGPIAIS